MSPMNCRGISSSGKEKRRGTAVQWRCFDASRRQKARQGAGEFNSVSAIFACPMRADALSLTAKRRRPHRRFKGEELNVTHLSL